ncbi:cation diffusion facilitator family transporter [Parvicella tangerina]|uniref:Manganese efflux system protein MneP n=1 Tax=Parvicella tangerina TaxID=2829795 RepID=A0A916NHP8_9FLAO|nr:cation diffusion facilitator family transporter [Parvicella tangerina]CAG5083438.1 Manganese efflux system protein MneP [Parvicella tangerina]
MKTTKNTAVRTVLLGLLLNVLLVVIKGVSGYLGDSYALMADAIESSTDVFASLFLIFGMSYVNRPADDNHPYGHGRLEPLLTFVIVMFLMISAGVIAFKSIEHIQNPHNIPAPFTLIVLGVIIVFKELSFQYVRRKGKQLNSTSLQAEAWHHRSDAITSLMAFLGISIALIFGKGFENADDWAALLASVFIVYNAYKLFRPAFGEMMDEHLHEELEVKIRLSSEKIKGVLGTEKCRIRKVGSGYFVDLHVIVDGSISVKSGHTIAHEVKGQIFSDLDMVRDVLVHIEPDDELEKLV